MIVFVLLRGNYKYYFADIIKHPVVAASLLFYGLHWIWYIQLDNPTTLVLDLKRNVAYLLYVPLFMAIVDKRFVHHIISAFLLAMMLSELISYGMHFGVLPWEFIFKAIELPWHDSVRDLVVYAPFWFYKVEPAPFLQHSVYTAALAFSVSVMIYRLFKNTTTLLHRTVMIVFIITMTYNIALVGGRAGYFIYLALLLIVIVAVYRQKALLSIVVLTGFFAFMGFWAYYSSAMFQQRIDYTVHNAATIWNNPMDFNSSEGGRLGMWYYGSGVIKENIWFGASKENLVEATHAKIPVSDRKMFEDWYFIPHSFYLDTLLAFGVFGFVLWLNVLFWSLRSYHKAEELNIARILAVTMVGMSLLSTDPIEFFFFPFMAFMIGITTMNRHYLVTVPRNSWKILLQYGAMAILAFGVGIVQ